jgi:hypothetical protein
MMDGEIGVTAGAIWHVLSSTGTTTLPELKKKVDCKTPVFDWAIGWLAREDKIAITRERKSFHVSLKNLLS